MQYEAAPFTPGCQQKTVQAWSTVSCMRLNFVGGLFEPRQHALAMHIAPNLYKFSRLFGCGIREHANAFCNVRCCQRNSALHFDATAPITIGCKLQALSSSKNGRRQPVYPSDCRAKRAIYGRQAPVLRIANRLNNPVKND